MTATPRVVQVLKKDRLWVAEEGARRIVAAVTKREVIRRAQEWVRGTREPAVVRIYADDGRLLREWTYPVRRRGPDRRRGGRSPGAS